MGLKIESYSLTLSPWALQSGGALPWHQLTAVTLTLIDASHLIMDAGRGADFLYLDWSRSRPFLKDCYQLVELLSCCHILQTG